MTEIVDKQFLDFLLRIPVLIHFAININQSKYLLKIFWQLFWLFVRQSCQKWYSYVRWKSSWDLWPQILQPYIWLSQYDMIYPHISPKKYLVKAWAFVRRPCQKRYLYVRWTSSWDSLRLVMSCMTFHDSFGASAEVLQPYIWPSRYGMVDPHIGPCN